MKLDDNNLRIFFKLLEEESSIIEYYEDTRPKSILLDHPEQSKIDKHLDEIRKGKDYLFSLTERVYIQDVLHPEIDWLFLSNSKDIITSINRKYKINKFLDK